VLVNNGILMIANLIQVAEVTSEYITYIEPQYLLNPSHKRDVKSDIYSLGILLWELSSGRPPFFEHTQKAFGLIQIEKKLLNGEKEKPVADTPLEYLQLYQKCWQDDPHLRPEINEVYEVLSKLKLQINTNKQLKAQVTDVKNLSSTADNDRFVDKEISLLPYKEKITLEISESTAQEMVRQFKLNHGIVLNGYDIISSIRGVAVEDGELKVNLYEGSPLVCTSINSEDNELKIDTCISFPVAEIVYNGNLLKSFLEYTNDEKELHELCGDFLARKFLVGDQLFIENFNLATTTEANILKNYLFCVDNSVKYSTEIQFSNLFTLNLLPKLVTLNGKKINTHEKLINWMNNLYQKKMVNIISYDDLIPISRLKDGTSLIDEDFDTFEVKQPGIANFKEMLGLDDWTEDAADNNLMSWAEDFNLFQGLITNDDDEYRISKKIPIDIIKIPKVNSSDKFYLEIIKPSTKLDFTLISNNIFSTINLHNFPFTRNNINNDKKYESFNHVIIRCEKYEIFLDKDNIKPTKEFEQAIEVALNSMKPLKALQDVFNEYGHLFPQRIVLGKSLKKILPNLSPFNAFNDVNDDNKIIELIDNLNISYLLTKKGRIVEKNDLLNWIRNSNYLEIIEFDYIVPLYKILKEEQQIKIDNLLKNEYKILMTGITRLTDLNNNNVVNYKRVNFELSSLEDENYEVFGLIISENNTKLEETRVSFGLYDFNGFYAIIKNENKRIDITKYYIIWIMIGNSSRSSIFSPNNRDFEVNYLKKSIKLRPNKPDYYIKTCSPLYEGYTVLLHVDHSSINYDIIKIVKWSERSINVQIESSDSLSDRDSDPKVYLEIDLHICILPTNYKSLKIDNDEEKEYPLNLIGHVLNNSNENDISVDITNDEGILFNFIIYFFFSILY
jgi:hypothetical protein